MLYVFYNEKDDNKCAEKVLKELKNPNTKVIEASCLWRYKNFFCRLLLHVGFYFHVPLNINFSKVFFISIRDIGVNDKILLFGGGIGIPIWMCYPFLKIIKSANRYIWLWDSVITKSDRKYLAFEKKYFSVFTFDKVNADKYGLMYKNTVCSFPIINNIEVIPKNDIFFVGQDRGRYEKINLLYEKFTVLGFKCNFIILRDETSGCELSLKYASERITLEESYVQTLNSRAVLDIPINGQAGITQRPLEALFLGRKVITTNINIESEALYNSNSIFVVGKRSLSALKEFLDKESTVSECVLDLYKINSWIREFIDSI